MSNKGPYGDFKLMQLLHKEIGLQRLCCTIKVLVLSQVMSIWLWLQGKRKSSRLNMRHDRSIHKVSNFNAYSDFSDDAAGSLWRNSNIQSTASKLDAENFPRTHQCFCFTCRHLFLRRILFLLFFLPGRLRNFHVCTRSRSIILAQNELKLQVFLTLCSPRTDNWAHFTPQKIHLIPYLIQSLQACRPKRTTSSVTNNNACLFKRMHF